MATPQASPEPKPLGLSGRRRALYAASAFVLVLVLACLAVLSVDVYLHRRVQDQAGVNIWGYRGDVVGNKLPGETRLAMFGGSTAFGYGLPADESIPVFLERRLQTAIGGEDWRISVVNLGAPGEGAYGFLFNLIDYAYLDYDIVVLYEGYNDLGVEGVPEGVPHRASPNYLLWRRQSPVFRLVGYYPIFPLVFREKAMAILYDGDLDAAYGGEQVVFRPGLGDRATAQALATAAGIGQALERQLGGLSDVPPPAPSVDEGCRTRWKQYCGAVRDAVRWSLEHDKRVLVVTQPYVSDAHIEQQADLAAMLRARFGGDARVSYVNLGRSVDLRDRSVAYDGLHLVADANDRIAAALVEPVKDLLP